MVKPRKGTPNAPPDEVLRQLAKLADVSPKHRKFYFDEVSTHLQASHDVSGLAKGALANERGATLQRAAVGLYQKLGDLKNGERQLIESILDGTGKLVFERISGEGFSGLLKTTYQLALLFNLVTGKPQPRTPGRRPQPSKRGRKSGHVKNPAFQEFIWSLLISTKTAGGKLTLEKNGRFGTLMDAIEMLSPHLPEAFASSPLHPSTLQRIKTKCDQIFDELAAIDGQ